MFVSDWRRRGTAPTDNTSRFACSFRSISAFYRCLACAKSRDSDRGRRCCHATGPFFSLLRAVLHVGTGIARRLMPDRCWLVACFGLPVVGQRVRIEPVTGDGNIEFFRRVRLVGFVKSARPGNAKVANLHGTRRTNERETCVGEQCLKNI